MEQMAGKIATSCYTSVKILQRAFKQTQAYGLRFLPGHTITRFETENKRSRIGSELTRGPQTSLQASSVALAEVP